MRLVFPTHTGRLINELASDMNTFFDSVLGEEGSGEDKAVVPRMDVEETDQHWLFHFDLPGVGGDDLNLDLEDDRLTIHGVRRQRYRGEGDENRRRVERTFGAFRRVISLPDDVDRESVEASYEDGVLTVQLAKSAKPEPRRIVVRRDSATPKSSAEAS